MTTVPLVGLSKDTLDTVDYLEKIICFVSYLSFHLLLNNFLVNDLKRKIKFIDDIALNDQIKGHVLTNSPDFLCDPFMQTSDGVTFQVFRFDLPNRQINILDGTSFVFLFPLHLFFRNFQSNDEVSSLRSQYFIDMIKIKIFFGVIITIKA